MVRGLVGPTNNTHRPPTFQCEAMRVSAKTLQGGWVEGVGHQVKKKRNPEVHNKKKKSTPLNETIIHETHLQLHQVQTNNHEP